MPIVSLVKSKGGTGEEVFTLDEGRVTITYPANLSGASLNDLKQYLDIFYRKASRLTDDPVDSLDPKLLEGKLLDRKKLSIAAE
jgi:hypothetical protein